MLGMKPELNSAKSVFKARGFDAHNGGGWQSLQSKAK